MRKAVLNEIGRGFCCYGRWCPFGWRCCAAHIELAYEQIGKAVSDMTVYCELETCKYNQNYECNRGVISLDCDGECQDFEDLYDEPEWQKPYWKRLIDRETKKIYRVLFHGKEIEVGGKKFFVDYNNDYASATEETTGLNCGNRCELEGRIDKIIENIAKCKLPPLESLPIGEYDEKTRKVKPKQEGQEGE